MHQKVGASEGKEKERHDYACSLSRLYGVAGQLPNSLQHLDTLSFQTGLNVDCVYEDAAVSLTSTRVIDGFVTVHKEILPRLHNVTCLPTDISESSVKVWLILQQVDHQFGRTPQLA